MSPKYVWFITGTSSGLGNALLHELLREGHSVVATTRNPSALQAELQGKYDAETIKRALIVKLDVRKVDEVKTVLAKAVEKFGRIDIVVNNAGYVVLGEVEVCPLEEAREQFEVMFWGAVHVSKEVIRIFREVNPPGAGGHIFNISSSGGYSSQPIMAYYDASKFALEGFSESLRKEMSPEWNIQVTVMEPGGFNTDWRNGKVIPTHPAYQTDSSPVKQYRSMLETLPFIGNPFRAAKAFLVLADKKKELPLRVQLGSDSLAIVRHAAGTVISDSEKYESLTHSTNVDGIDPVEYTKSLLAVL